MGLFSRKKEEKITKPVIEEFEIQEEELTEEVMVEAETPPVVSKEQRKRELDPDLNDKPIDVPSFL